jgi:hypothetical protein
MGTDDALSRAQILPSAKRKPLDMPYRPAARRPRTFETMEPRLLLAADVSASAVLDPVIDAILHLPGSIAGRVVATAELGGESSFDSGISGVRLELLSAAGDVLAEAITDDTGGYEFPALEAGVYGVRELQPEGFLDGLSLVGSGGGGVLESNLITEIVVQSGDQLVGYDFVEMPEPAIAVIEPISTPLFVGPMLSPTIDWSRPSEIAIPPQSGSAASTPRSLPPLTMRPADPVYGGSSAIPREKEMATDAVFSDDGDEDKAVDVRVTRSDQPTETPEDVKRMAANRLRHAARDQAFESTDDLEAIETPEADPQQPPLRVARKPAA